MFRYYKLKKVVIKIKAVATSSNYEAVEGQEYTTNEYCYCPVTDGNWPTGRDQMMQCSGYKSKLATQGAKITLVPTILNSVYGSSTSTHYTQSKSPWISTGYTSTPHWGLQILTVNAPVGSVYQYGYHRTEVTYYFAFKGQR